MRNLLTILALVLSSSSLFAQGQPDIVVRNATSCPVYYRLFLSNVANPCSPVYSSGTLILPPASSAMFSNTSFPGSYHFIRVSVINAAPSCASSNVVVGDPVCSIPSTASLNLFTNSPSCAFCGTAAVDWVLGGVGSLQTVVIH